MTYLPYAGIGSRETPDAALQRLHRICAVLAYYPRFILRSGGAEGADTACYNGCVAYNGAKEIYIPWKGFGLVKDGIVPFQDEYAEPAMKIAEAFHPNWKACSRAAKLLHTRNVAQVLGPDLKSLSKFVVCYTDKGQGKGGTGQALRIAHEYEIPIYDLGRGLDYETDRLQEYVNHLINE